MQTKIAVRLITFLGETQQQHPRVSSELHILELVNPHSAELPSNVFLVLVS